MQTWSKKSKERLSNLRGGVEVANSDKDSGQFALNFHSGYQTNESSCSASRRSGNVVGFVDLQTRSARNDAVRRARSNGIFSDSSRKR